MNKTTIFIIAGVAVLGVAAAYVFLKPGTNPEKYRQEQNQKRTEIRQDFEEKRSLSDYLFGPASSPGLKCEQVVPIADQSVLTVTAYIAGERVAVHYDMDPPVQGQSNMHIVTDREYAYMWGDAYLANGTKGLKIELGENEKPEELENSPVDFDTPLDHCTPWEPDVDTFTIPTAIEFQTMAEMMGGMDVNIDFNEDGGNEEEDTEDPCELCAMLHPSQQPECEQALGCE